MSAWTQDRENKLRILWAQGLSCSQIAKQLGGTTRNAVIGKRIRLGLPDRAPTTVSHRTGKARVRSTPAKRIIPSLPRARRETSPPTVKIERVKLSAPARGPNSVRFNDRASNQCPMFCAGEEGPDGFVCGEAVTRGAWCEDCARLVWSGRTAAELVAA